GPGEARTSREAQRAIGHRLAPPRGPPGSLPLSGRPEKVGKPIRCTKDVAGVRVVSHGDRQAATRARGLCLRSTASEREDLRPLPLVERRRRLERLLRRAKVPCLRLVEAFDDGQALLEVAERHQLEGW